MGIQRESQTGKDQNYYCRFFLLEDTALNCPFFFSPLTLERIFGWIMAPERRDEIVSPGIRSIIGGTIATCMTGAVVGIITG